MAKTIPFSSQDLVTAKKTIPFSSSDTTNPSTPSTSAPAKQGFFSKIGSAIKNVVSSLTQSEQNLGKDIGHAIEAKSINKTTQQYIDNANTLTALAATQKDPVLQQKYATMAAGMLTDGQKVGLDLKGRSAEQIIGDVLGTVADVAIVALPLFAPAVGASAKVGQGMEQALKTGAIQGLKTGAVYGGAIGVTHGLTSGLQNNESVGGVVKDIAVQGVTGAVSGAVLGTATGAISGVMQQAKLNKVIEATNPVLNKAEKATLIAKGKTDIGITGSVTPKVNSSDIQRGIDVREYYNGNGAKFADNIIKKGIPETSMQVESELTAFPADIDKKAFTTAIGAAQPKTIGAGESKMTGVIQQIKDKAMEILDNSDSDTISIWRDKSQLMNWFTKNKPIDPDKLNVATRFILDINREFDTQIAEATSAVYPQIEQQFTPLMSKLSNMYEAATNLGEKNAWRVGLTGAEQLAKTHPGLMGKTMGSKIAIGSAVGTGAVTGLAAFVKYLFSNNQ